MKNFVLISLLVFVLFSQLHPAKLHTFFDISKPRMLVVDRGNIYISDRYSHSVHVYDLKKFNLIKKLCRKGEGPLEMTAPPFININNGKIFLSSDIKIIVYSKNFELQEEIRPGIWLPVIVPVHDNFVALNHKIIDNRKFSVVEWFNEKFKKIKEIPISPGQTGDYLFFSITYVRSWKDRIYVNYPGKGFVIGVFDKNGEQLYSIEKKLEKIKSAERHRQRFLDYSINALGKKLFNTFKARKRFDKPLPKYLPDIKEFSVSDDKIYVKTYDVRDNQDKYIILDLKGHILEIKYLPKAFYNKFTFSSGKFYYLVDNEEKEGWELHMIEL